MIDVLNSFLKQCSLLTQMFDNFFTCTSIFAHFSLESVLLFLEAFKFTIRFVTIKLDLLHECGKIVCPTCHVVNLLLAVFASREGFLNLCARVSLLLF